MARKHKIGIIGLGYVGLPLAIEFSKNYEVLGYDIKESRVKTLRCGQDTNGEVELDNPDLHFSSDASDLSDVTFYIVTVPTPVDEHKVPNLEHLIRASKEIGSYLKKGDYVVFESTTYPGCTEEDCTPVLESVSGMTSGEDFNVGFSPERINPGDPGFKLRKTVKVVSGDTEESKREIAEVYTSVIDAGVYLAESIKVAEAAKIVENTQRDLNISLMNELSIIFDKVEVSTMDVIHAASTKWNFMPFYPGLVGGHCIAVDPFYLTYKSKQLGYDPQVISSGRRVNDFMPKFIAKKTIQLLLKSGRTLLKSNILVLGVTFKPDVNDVRNSKVFELIQELKDYSILVDVYDPLVIEYSKIPTCKYSAVIFAVNHKEIIQNAIKYRNLLQSGGVLIDVKSVHDFPDKDFIYWAL